VFRVLDGRAVYRFAGDDREIVAGPGTVLHARRDQAHLILVPGPDALILLVSVTPNEDVADETPEGPGS
jgi:quercetin dioxygenase-like cupin family protein